MVDLNFNNNKLNLEKLTLSSESDSNKFTLGSFPFKAKNITIQDSKYGPIGTTIDLEAEIPTFTDLSTHHLPNSEDLDIGVEEIFTWLTAHNVVRSKGKSVLETKSKIRGVFIHVYISFRGRLSVLDPIIITCSSAAVLIVIVDDLIEKLQVFELDGKIGKIIVQGFKKAFEFNSGEKLGIEGLGSIPSLEPAFRAFTDLKEREERITKQLLLNSSTMLENLSSVLLIQSEKENIYTVPEETFLFIRSHDAGGAVPLESVVKMQNINLSEEVQNSVLLKRFEQLFCYVSAELNDLIGIKRDLMDVDGPGVGFVFYYVNNQNLSLVDAWNKAVQRLNSDSNEIIFVVNKILDCFPEEEGLDEYFEIGLRMLDICGYHCVMQLADRYQNEK